MKIVNQLKESNQDYEWYPTTTEILDTVKKDLLLHNPDFNNSIMDIGSGDGRALQALTKGKKYAIEKSKILIEKMDKDIFILGTDFHNNTLIDKKVDIVFCNPPYSDYSNWTTKIIKEANSTIIYLVIPARWKENKAMQEAIELREGRSEILDSFDFLNAERKARAKIDIVKIELYIKGYGYRNYQAKVDPFDTWFEEQFNFDKVREKKNQEPLKQRLENELVKGSGIISALVELYNHELQKIWSNFKLISELDSDIFKELDIGIKNLKESLKVKITGLKDRYWQEFFDNYKPITKKLTKKKREKLLNTLTKNTGVDFTESNCYVVTVWVCKNCNQYFDKQLVDTVESMVKNCNIKNYKSNKKVWDDDEWRYWQRDGERRSHYLLELRIVINQFRAIWNTYGNTNNLHNNCHDFINDLVVIANNLGYACNDTSLDREWKSNKKQNFYYESGPGKQTILFEVKAFKNGNLHIKFNQKFIRTLNIEFGRLGGWIKSPKEASEEMGYSLKDCQSNFNSNLQLTNNDILQITAK